jgi:hypothetical protein
MGSIEDLLPDPSPPIRGDNISTLLLYSPLDFTVWDQFEASFDKTVAAGFAALGGLWAFFSGAFFAFFAKSLASSFSGASSFLSNYLTVLPT